MLGPWCDFELWPHRWHWPSIFKVKYWNFCISGMGGRLTWNERVWVGYDGGSTIGLILGRSAWQIDRPSNGSMWNSYSFQPDGPMNGLFIHWSRDWGVLPSYERLVPFPIKHLMSDRDMIEIVSVKVSPVSQCWVGWHKSASWFSIVVFPQGPFVQKHWRATTCCEKSKFAISSAWLKSGSVCYPDDLITLQ